MQARVLGPLGMKDTAFTQPADLSRVARVYHRDPAGNLVGDDRKPSFPFESGGGGLYSTAPDYARFAQMLLNGGEYGGKRILGRKTVAFMTSNQLRNLEDPRKGPFLPPGFGFGVRVRLDNPADYPTLGSPGEYGWEGIMTTYVSIDPSERMFMLVLTQHQPYDEHSLFESFANATYQALEK
jgi:CubicO group peptidase (beta-lactamase class C family)